MKNWLAASNVVTISAVVVAAEHWSEGLARDLCLEFTSPSLHEVTPLQSEDEPEAYALGHFSSFPQRLSACDGEIHQTTPNVGFAWSWFNTWKCGHRVYRTANRRPAYQVARRATTMLIWREHPSRGGRATPASSNCRTAQRASLVAYFPKSRFAKKGVQIPGSRSFSSKQPHSRG